MVSCPYMDSTNSCFESYLEIAFSRLVFDCIGDLFPKKLLRSAVIRATTGVAILIKAVLNELLEIVFA